jgi:FAD/FMN-containing dehydrogenase
MGGQQFLRDSELIDMSCLNRVISFDLERGLITAEAGIRWRPLIESYLSTQLELEPDRAPRWGITQKQTGADDLTLGGALSANAHGRGLTRPPIVSDVESFTLINPDGNLVHCDRHHNEELFRLAIGGYGLFGVIVTVTLRLSPRIRLRRIVRVIDIDDAVLAVRRRIDAGSIYGDFQFDIDPYSPTFLTKGVFACYEPVKGESIEHEEHELSADDWERLLHLAHTNKKAAFDQYAMHYVATDGRQYWSDTHQLGVYLPNYHEELDRKLGSSCRCTELITELYVPHEHLVDFLHASAQMLTNRNAEVIYGTIRLIRADTETFLPWAKQDQACVIFNLHVQHTPQGLEHAAGSFRSLIDLAIERGGSFFLTYHRFASREQLLAAYPQISDFLKLKDRYDPAGVFESDWSRWLREIVTS